MGGLPRGCPGPGGCPFPILGGVQTQAWGVSKPRPGRCIPACTEADTPQRTATAANGTHPAGMHSCYVTELVIEYVKMCPVTNSTTFRLYMEHRKSSIGALKVCYVS